MEETTQNPEAGRGDPEKTLVTPRFDAREALTAQPVVPLTETATARDRRHGTLPLVLILVSALVGGLVSVLAYRLYQQRGQMAAREQQQQLPAAVESPTPAQPEPTPELPAEVAEAQPEEIDEPEPTPETEVVAAAVRAEPEPEPAPRAEAKEDKASRETRERASVEERTARPSAPAAERTKAPRARRVEEITAPTRDIRIERERYDGREASDYEVAPRRARRTANRRGGGGRRNMDRVRAIFEGPPPAP